MKRRSLTLTLLAFALCAMLLLTMTGCGDVGATSSNAVATPTATTPPSFASSATSEVPTPTPSPTPSPFVPTPTAVPTSVPTAAPGYDPGMLPTWQSKAVKGAPTKFTEATLTMMLQGIKTTLQRRGQSALANEMSTDLQVQAIESDDSVMSDEDVPLGTESPDFVMDFCNLQAIQVVYQIDERVATIASVNLPLADTHVLLSLANYLGWLSSSPRSELTNSAARSCVAGWIFNALINAGITTRYYRDTIRAYMPSPTDFDKGYAMTGDYGQC